MINVAQASILSGVIDAETEISDGKIVEATAEIVSSEIDAEGEVVDLIIDAEAEIADSIIDVSASLVTAVAISVDTYSGSYEATPKTDTSDQVFATINKFMTSNFLVHTIPTTEEYNDAGGVTFTIGGE